MKPTVEQLENLLALKRHERPEEGYWQDFLCEFHHRQREQAVMKSGIAGFTQRVAEWFAEMSPSKWAYGIGLAYATAAAAFLLTPRGVDYDHTAPQPVKFEVVPAPAPIEQLEALDFSPSSPGSAGEQVF